MIGIACFEFRQAKPDLHETTERTPAPPVQIEHPAILAEDLFPASVDPQSGSDASKTPNPVNLSGIGSCNTRSRVARRSLTDALARIWAAGMS
jgi:hypothetical protein